MTDSRATATTKTAGKTSPEELLRQAVTGTLPAPARRLPLTLSRRTLRLAGVGTASLVLGIAIGVSAAPREGGSEALNALRASVDSGRAEAARLDGEIARLAKSVAALREAGEAARSEARGLGAGLNERLGRLEQGLDRKIAGLSETLSRAERDATARLAGLTAQFEHRAAPAVARVEPKAEAAVQTTGSIPEKPRVEASKAEPARVEPARIEAAKTESAKTEAVKTEAAKPETARPATVEAWALRDVYDGLAILEDRRRRLVEVGPGDAIPGVGKVESIERRGRAWVVVTRQGLITPQAW